MNFRGNRHCGCQKPCHCQKPAKEIVYPVKENVVHCCTEETVKHIHPSHTTVVNHHLVKNKHVFPHSTSVENTFNEVDMFPGGGGMGPGGMGPGSVGGAMSPGKKHGMCGQMGWNNNVAGAQQCNNFKGKKGNKWR